MFVIDPADGDPRLVAEIEGSSLSGAAFGWSADGQALYYLARDALAVTHLWMVPVQGGAATRIASITPLSGLIVRTMVVHDRRIFLSVETSESNVWVAELLKHD